MSPTGPYDVNLRDADYWHPEWDQARTQAEEIASLRARLAAVEREWDEWRDRAGVTEAALAKAVQLLELAADALGSAQWADN